MRQFWGEFGVFQVKMSQFWVNLGHFGRKNAHFGGKLGNFGVFWVEMCQFWVNLGHLGRKNVHFGGKWGEIWGAFVGIWGILGGNESIWGEFGAFGVEKCPFWGQMG